MRPLRELWSGRLLESGGGRGAVVRQRLVELVASELAVRPGARWRLRGAVRCQLQQLVCNH